MAIEWRPGDKLYNDSGEPSLENPAFFDRGPKKGTLKYSLGDVVKISELSLNLEKGIEYFLDNPTGTGTVKLYEAFNDIFGSGYKLVFDRVLTKVYNDSDGKLKDCLGNLMEKYSFRVPE